MKRFQTRIGGVPRTTSHYSEIRSPFDGAPVGEVGHASANEMEAALAQAIPGFLHMRSLPTHQRAQILEQTSRAIEQRAVEFSRLIALESGKPIQFCRAEVARAVITFRLGAEECRRLGGEVIPVDLEPRAEGRLCLYRRVPRGPVAAISPFNFPLNLIAHKLSPAIAAGTSVVLKPPPQAPLTGHLLAEVLHAAGLPEGVLSVLHCVPEVAEIMVRDDRIKVLSFTGSDSVGWRLKELAGKKHVLLELGGNAPCVIDEGIALDSVLGQLLSAAWANAGQTCIKAQRFFVHERLFDTFLDRFIERTRLIKCGDPLLEDTVVGPLIESRHVTRVTDWIKEAVENGAQLLTGGNVSGNLVEPAILTNTRPDMRVRKDEVFGPVAIVEPFETFDEALELCNDSRFGLQVGVFTHEVGRALRAFEELDYGGVLINDSPMFRVDNFPYGGTKDSGLGREGVRFALQEMTEPKVLMLRGL